MFENRAVHNDAIESESRQVDRLETSLRNQFHNGPADGRRLLDTMAAETGGEYQIPVVRMDADDGILIESVVVVIASPCTFQLKFQFNS